MSGWTGNTVLTSLALAACLGLISAAVPGPIGKKKNHTLTFTSISALLEDITDIQNAYTIIHYML